MEGHTMIDEIRFSITDCSLGYLLIARSTRGLCASLLGDDPTSLRLDLERRFPQAALREVQVTDDDLLQRAVALVESDGRDAGLPLDLRAPLSSCGSGRLSVKLVPDTPPPMPASRPGSGLRGQSGRWLRPAPQIRWQSLSLVTGWFAATGSSPGIAGESSANERCWPERLPHERNGSAGSLPRAERRSAPLCYRLAGRERGARRRRERDPGRPPLL